MTGKVIPSVGFCDGSWMVTSAPHNQDTPFTDPERRARGGAASRRAVELDASDAQRSKAVRSADESHLGL